VGGCPALPCDPTLARRLADLDGLLATVLAGAIVLHVAGAILHRGAFGEPVLHRMAISLGHRGEQAMEVRQPAGQRRVEGKCRQPDHPQNGHLEAEGGQAPVARNRQQEKTAIQDEMGALDQVIPGRGDRRSVHHSRSRPDPQAGERDRKRERTERQVGLNQRLRQAWTRLVEQRVQRREGKLGSNQANGRPMDQPQRETVAAFHLAHSPCPVRYTSRSHGRRPP